LLDRALAPVEAARDWRSARERRFAAGSGPSGRLGRWTIPKRTSDRDERLLNCPRSVLNERRRRRVSWPCAGQDRAVFLRRISFQVRSAEKNGARPLIEKWLQARAGADALRADPALVEQDHQRSEDGDPTWSPDRNRLTIAGLQCARGDDRDKAVLSRRVHARGQSDFKIPNYIWPLLIPTC